MEKDEFSDFTGPLHIDQEAAKRLIIVRALNQVPSKAKLRIESFKNPMTSRLDFDLFFDSQVSAYDVEYKDNGTTVVLDERTALSLMGSTLSVNKKGDFTLIEAE
jgi:Fe-S cluster assembly iron-binding protein IscA|tara:strand:- start:1607 stop:1921 length:315 start_codon:yes stop_codon:yes gene_type:complete